MKITEVLRRLSVDPSEELEKKYQNLIRKKRELDD